MEGICTCLPTFVFKILVLVKAFFLFKFWLQKYSKIASFSSWQDLGFGELFFSIQIQITKVFKN